MFQTNIWIKMHTKDKALITNQHNTIVSTFWIKIVKLLWFNFQLSINSQFNQLAKCKMTMIIPNYYKTKLMKYLFKIQIICCISITFASRIIKSVWKILITWKTLLISKLRRLLINLLKKISGSYNKLKVSLLITISTKIDWKL